MQLLPLFLLFPFPRKLLTSRQNGIVEYTVLKPRSFESLLTKQNASGPVPNYKTYGIGFFSMAEGRPYNLGYIPGKLLHLPEAIHTKSKLNYAFAGTDKGRCKLFPIRKKQELDPSIELSPPQAKRIFDNPTCWFQIDGLVFPRNYI